MQSEKMCVVLLFGGMSSEHEVSRVSVGNFVNNIDREKYETLAVGITKEGRWLYTEATAAQMADGSWEGAGRHPLRGLRRAGKRSVHGQSRGQRSV